MQEFINIFAQMGWLSATLLIVGALLFIAECLTPGFGVAGITGVICLILGVVARVVEGATLVQTLLLLILIIVVVCALFAVFVHSAKKGLLSKTSIIENGTVISNDYGKVSNLDLVGKEGVTSTICKPSGKVEIDGKTYDAITNGSFIDVGKKVVVDKVEIDYLYIKEIKNQ
ncbi:MAG: NfeD family protein [Christensenellales bacterium]